MDSGEWAEASDTPQNTGQATGSASAEALAALTARVLALEQEVAMLRRGAAPAGPARVPPAPVAPPPLPRTPLPMAPPRFQPVHAPEPPPPARSLEERFGSQLFNMIGIVAIFIAAALGLKLAVDKGLIGPVARVLIGLAAGVGVVVWSETFRKKGLQVFSWSLKATGSGVLYLSLWAAFQMFGLLPAWAALGAMVLVTAWNAFMAWSQDAELLAAYALVGGFLTPLLLATGGNHEVFLFSYLAALDLGLVLLLRDKPWTRLLLPTFAVTVLYFIGWYAGHFPDRNAVTLDMLFWQTSLFIVLFFAIFAAVSLRGFSAASDPAGSADSSAPGIVVPVLLPLGNAAWLSLALYSVFEDSGLHVALAWLMVALAALYLGLMRMQRSHIAAAVHLACAVVFLTVAIPLKASGHSLTIAWLVEGMVLLWVSTRFADPAEQPQAAASVRVLRLLAATGYGLGLSALTLRFLADHGRVLRFFNADLGSALVAAATLAGAVWLGRRKQLAGLSFAALPGLGFVGLLLTAPELLHDFSGTVLSPFANAPFWTAIVGLAVLAGSAWSATHLARPDARAGDGRGLALALGVLANLVAIVAVVREIDGLFRASGSVPDADLQRSLAVSGFLMLYGAALLTAGFLRRGAITRWQALILILFTICKVFLYDLSALSQGYRIVSVFALGALLMGVSLAYQRDWLGLRAAKPEPPREENV